jgi:hypothetical protein
VTTRPSTVILHIAITILHIIHHPVFHLKYYVSNTAFCVRLQTETTQAATGKSRIVYIDTSLSQTYG